MQETWFNSWVRKIHRRRDRLPTPVFFGFPCGSAGKESSCNEGNLGSIPGLGRSLGEGKGYPLQSSGLGNSMDCIVHGVAKSQTWLSDFHHHHHVSYYSLLLSESRRWHYLLLILDITSLTFPCMQGIGTVSQWDYSNFLRKNFKCFVFCFL